MHAIMLVYGSKTVVMTQAYGGTVDEKRLH